MKLNKKQFEEYIRKNGITKARLNKKFHHIPENTELWFGLWCKNISTYIHHIPENTELWFGLWYKNISTYNSDTENKNKRFNYEFDYDWLWKNYKGEFIIEEEEKEMLVNYTKNTF